MLPVGEDAAEGFYRLVDACYETRSLAVSSNLDPAGFDELMPNTLATATVDRLLHHAHVCVTEGQSFRLAQATGKGVAPLPSWSTGEIPCPCVGSIHGHQRGDLLAISGENYMTVDSHQDLERG
jgi:IstB-like ATP binding protein